MRTVLTNPAWTPAYRRNSNDRCHQIRDLSAEQAEAVIAEAARDGFPGGTMYQTAPCSGNWIAQVTGPGDED